ncbi:beta-1,3-glucan-binding protein-like [Littorina saxatilis]|uniref:Uncharacterized protein n=1 Tax=Littorina saxatilis TaxID=31220 RepID=A0AAN9AKF0_9CAEN
MWRKAEYIVFSCLVAVVTSQVHFPDPVVSNNGGLEFRLKDNGYRLVAFHYNVNKPLAGVSHGDHAADVTAHTGNEWVHRDNDVQLQPGDTVHYWVMVIKTTGEGLQITDRTWTYVPTSTTVSINTPTTTTTNPPTTKSASLNTVISGGSHTSSVAPGSTSQTVSSSQTGSGSNTGSASTTGGSSNFGTNAPGTFGSNTGSASTTGGSSNFGTNAPGTFGSNTGSASTTGGSSNFGTNAPGTFGSNNGSASTTGGSSNFGTNAPGTFGSNTGSASTFVGKGDTGCSCNYPYGPGIGDGFIDDRTCTSFPCLVFEDNFNFINHRVWEHEITAAGGGNWEFQYYTNNRTNSYTKNGVLYIKPTLTSDHYGVEYLEHGALNLWGSSAADVCTSNMDWGCKREGQPGQVINPIQSARLRSSRGFNFRYGKVEVEAKLPAGDWLWPAIWMLPRSNVYGNWPASGEIDIMESRGNLHYTDPKGTSQGVDNIGSTLHFGADFFTNQWPKAHTEVLLSTGGTYADDFHKFGVEWDNTSITFSVDGHETLKVAPSAGGFWEFGGFDQMQGYDNPWREGTRMAPFDQEFYLVMNVAVGGVGFFPDENRNSPQPKPWQDRAGHEADRFWAARNQWYPTWHPDHDQGEDAAMKVNYVKVWKTRPDPPRH